VLPQAEAKESQRILVYFSWPPLETGLSIAEFRFFIYTFYKGFLSYLNVVCIR